MLLSSDEVFQILKDAGLTSAKDKQIVLRWKRNGFIKAKIDSRKKGVWFEEKEVKKFINNRKGASQIEILEMEIEKLSKKIDEEKKTNQKLVEEIEFLREKVHENREDNSKHNEYINSELIDLDEFNLDRLITGISKNNLIPTELINELDSFENVILSMRNRTEQFKENSPNESGYKWAATLGDLALNRITKIKGQINNLLE
ncbi:hypothetical protein ACFFK0_07920 [Paenibacillus chartarius]|uniref:HTH merR-type domain-containing protein n=1 Tax=Paenibacillus chartarius TaxID=747481 RepID=A0ABV6DIF7_9BACL